jgi:16S rRNA (guanine(966)-N(2))-methyltransferase RsmD
LAPAIAETDILDLFSGTGNLGIEALSRGARFAVLVDKSRECADIIKENLMSTSMNGKAEVITSEATEAVRRLAGEGRKFDIIFLDPPYNKKLVDKALYSIEENGIIKLDGIIAAEHDIDDEMQAEVMSLKLVRSQKYGDTILSFYKKASFDKDGANNETGR